MSDTTNGNDQAVQSPTPREKALKAAETIRQACRDIYNEAFVGKEMPNEVYEIYTRALNLDGHIEKALPAPQPTPTTGA